MDHARSLLNLQPLLKSGAVLFLGMSVANVGAYVFNLLVGRLLGPSDFGIFVALISVSLIVSVPATAIATVAARFASTFEARRANGELVSLVHLLEKIGLGLGAVFALLVVIVSGPVQHFLNIPDRSPVVVLGLTFIVSFLPQILRGFLQGLQRFPALAFNTAIDPIIRIPLTALAIQLGFGVSGVLASVGLTFVFTSYLAYRVVRRQLRDQAQPLDTAPIWAYARPTLVTLVSLALLSTLDVVLVKHYFSPETAGLYAGLATIGKIILYISTPLVSVMFPMIVTRVSKGEKHFPLLAQTFILITALSLFVLCLFIFFPTLSVGLLFGEQFLAAAPYLGYFGGAIFLLSLATVLVHYFLSIGVTSIGWLLAATLVLEGSLISRFHASLNEIIMSLTISYGSLFGLLVLLYLYRKRQPLMAAIKQSTSSVDISRVSTGL